MPRNERTYYKRNILISIIVSELLVISAFVLSPRNSLKDTKLIFSDPVILFDNIPQTTQSSDKEPPPPALPRINIVDDIDAYEILDDVATVQGTPEKEKETSGNYRGENNIQYTRSAPRLLYEVVPAGGQEDYHGSLQISLKINQDGKVIDHRILYNSLDCPDCLNELIKTAYKSKWEPAAVNGRNEEYWVVKSYSFN